MKSSFALVKGTCYKELKLAVSPAIYMFGVLSLLMVFIPNYPVWVGAFYCFIGINISFQKIVANKDVEFSLSLPLPRKYTVLGKLFNVIYSELIVMLFTLPAAIVVCKVIYPLYARLGMNTGGGLGLDANIAFFGFLFIAYGVFNLVFLPIYFKTAYKSGKALILGMLAFAVTIAIVEVLIAIIPPLKLALDSEKSNTIGYRFIVLAVGIICYGLINFLTYKISVKVFGKVNI